MAFSYTNQAFLLVSLSLLALSRSSTATFDSAIVTPGIGLLINFSVPCDLPPEISIPDRGGLLTPVLLAVGYIEYLYTGKSWVSIYTSAELYNKSGSVVGSLSASRKGMVTFKFLTADSQTDYGATVTATPSVSYYQVFSIPLQLLNVTASKLNSPYSVSDYVQKFGTINGLPPGSDYVAKKGSKFLSEFSAFYAFFLPFDTSPQLATRVQRCGDERFNGVQFGRGPCCGGNGGN